MDLSAGYLGALSRRWLQAPQIVAHLRQIGPLAGAKTVREEGRHVFSHLWIVDVVEVARGRAHRQGADVDDLDA